MVRTRYQSAPLTRTSGYGNARQSITVHTTDNEGRGANAAAHANLQARGNSRQASWHWQVDDTEAVQSFPHTVRCWHASKATGNNSSIAVEICVNSDGDYLKALSNAAELIRSIAHSEGITSIVQHNRWSGKNCPRPLRAGVGEVTWNVFLEMIARPLGTVVPALPDPEPIEDEVEEMSKWIKIEGGPESAWKESGGCRYTSKAAFDAVDPYPGIIVAPADDAFWYLPITGKPYTELYKPEGGSTAAFTVEAVDSILYRVWYGRAHYEAMGRPKILTLPGEHGIWSLPPLSFAEREEYDADRLGFTDDDRAVLDTHYDEG